MSQTTRRDILGGLASVSVAACASEAVTPPGQPGEQAATTGGPEGGPGAATLEARTLGSTGVAVDAFSLGGEGILRTRGRERDAVPMIVEAIELGVRYMDTAPAYAGSQDYYGAAFREAGQAARKKIFLATKTHERDRDGARALLDDSLKRLGTTWVDLWQMHDLRSADDLDQIFAKDGALRAAIEAKEQGLIRFIGITGHADPSILVEAMKRHPFDTVLAAMNPADPARAPFLSTVVVEARKRKMGVIGMKALAVGKLVADGVAKAPELIRYAASFADTVIIGCSSKAEVRANVAASRLATRMNAEELAALEARVQPSAERYDTFKA